MTTVSAVMAQFRRVMPWLLLASAVLLVFAPGLSGDFLFDDFTNIVNNPRVHADTIGFSELARAADAYHGPLGRPLATIGFAIDHAIGGLDPFTFKLHGLLVHLLNAILVALLCRGVLRLVPATALPGWTPWAIAATWALHPLQVSTVLYIVQRMEMLAATFILLGLMAYLRGRRRQIEGLAGWPWLAVAGALAGVGLLAKESAILFPLYALALELTLLNFRADNRLTGKRLRYSFALLLAAGFIGYFLVLVPNYGAAAVFGNRDFTPYERLMTQARVLVMYLQQMLLPLPSTLTFYYDNFPKSTGWMAPASTLACTLALALLLLCAAVVRRRMPLVSLGLFWFFIPHLLTSGLINLELAFEHRNYLALLGVVLAVCALLSRLPWRLSPDARATATLAIIVMLASLAAIRAATWGDPLVLAMDMASRNPTSSRASSDLGTVYAGLAMENPGSPYVDFAISEFERGAALPGASPLPEQGLILLSAAFGRPVDPDWWDRLENKLRHNPIGPQEVMAVTGLLNERMNGLSLDDQSLGKAYAILAMRGGASAEAYLGFANHAENYLHDEDLAEQLYVAAMASDTMTPEHARRVLAALSEDGKGRYWQASKREAVRQGLVGED